VHNFASRKREVTLTLDLPREAGRVLTNILSDDHSRARDSGGHRLGLEPYGYRWYRVG
jgi:maltose alpha-D-glucosyltransferase/alpha-amylase